jgi:hypothetical protein
MTQQVEKFVKVRNARSGVERLVPTNGTGVMNLLQDEYVVPFSLKDKWMLEKVANLIKERELLAIKAKLENLDVWAMEKAQAVPVFHLAELGQSKYPNIMSYEEQNRFRQENQDALSFYGIAIQYLERGHKPEEVKEIMEQRHAHHCGKDGVKAAFSDHSEAHKALLNLVHSY